MVRVEFDTSLEKLFVIVWMGQLSGILATLPELVPQTVSSLEWLLCEEGKTLATVAKCLLPFKKLKALKVHQLTPTKGMRKPLKKSP